MCPCSFYMNKITKLFAQVSRMQRQNQPQAHCSGKSSGFQLGSRDPGTFWKLPRSTSMGKSILHLPRSSQRSPKQFPPKKIQENIQKKYSKGNNGERNSREDNLSPKTGQLLSTAGLGCALGGILSPHKEPDAPQAWLTNHTIDAAHRLFRFSCKKPSGVLFLQGGQRAPAHPGLLCMLLSYYFFKKATGKP